MNLYFDVSEEAGFLVAVCHDPEMATQAQTVEELVKMVKELVECHFDEEDPRRSATPRFKFHADVPAYA